MVSPTYMAVILRTPSVSKQLEAAGDSWHSFRTSQGLTALDLSHHQLVVVMPVQWFAHRLPQSISSASLHFRPESFAPSSHFGLLLWRSHPFLHILPCITAGNHSPPRIGAKSSHCENSFEDRTTSYLTSPYPFSLRTASLRRPSATWGHRGAQYLSLTWQGI